MTQKSLRGTLALRIVHSFSIYAELLSQLDSDLGAGDVAVVESMAPASMKKTKNKTKTKPFWGGELGWIAGFRINN